MSETNKEGLEARFERVRLRTSKVLDERVKATLTSAGAAIGAEEPSRKRRTVMFRFMKTIGGKLSLAAAGAAIAVFVLAQSHTSALADSLKKLGEAHTTKCKMIVDEGTPKSRTFQMIFLDTGAFRITEFGGDIVLYEPGTGKTLRLLLKEKKALITTSSAVIHNEPAGFLARLRRLVAGSEERLGTREIDGVKAVGYHIAQAGLDWNIWIDPESEFPVRVEVKVTATGGRAVLSDFVFNGAMDQSLFSMTPPKGYIVIENTVPSTLPETKLLEGLRAAAKRDGTLPSEFRLLVVMGVIEDKGSQETEPGVFTQNIKVLNAEMLNLFKNSDTAWHYVGEGVKLGDASKAVCWWRPDKSKNYRVVYGDLSVKDVDPSNLPPSPGK